MDFKATGTARADATVLFRTDRATDLAKFPIDDAALKKSAADACKARAFEGKADQTLLLHGGAKGARLLLAGVGPSLDDEALRVAAGNAARALEAVRCSSVRFLVPGKEKELPARARAVVEGAGLASYVFDQCRTQRDEPTLARARVQPEKSGKGKGGGLAQAVKEGAAVVDAVNFARDLGNLPGNIAHAVYLAKRAKTLAAKGLTVRIHDRTAIERMRMGAFAAVARASTNEPRLIEISYRGAGAKAPTITVVGKGVTFDTGGISIKPSAKMEEMKFDMCGGAAVLGLVHLVRTLRPKVNLRALVPATDNMPGGAAYRPGDIVTARNGKTIEIISTDAEGRLLLCDTLAYAAEKKPACILDLATLTGACAVALGDAAAGLFSNDDGLRAQIERAGTASGDVVWPMPLFPRYTEMMKSPYADLKNGGGRYGGACTAAAFLQEFVAGVPWAHLDIAATAWGDRDKGYQRVGATGFGVRLLWEFLKERAA